MKRSTHRSRRLRNPQHDKKETPFFSPDSDRSVQAKETPFFQPKLTVNEPGDPYEKEADAMADAVVNQSGRQPAVQRKEISGIQRYMTNAEEDELGANTTRIEKDKVVQEKPDLQAVEEEEESVQMQAEEEEEMQMQPEEEEEVQMQEEEEEEMQMQEEEEEMQMQEEEEEEMQMKAAGEGPGTASPRVAGRIRASSGHGRPLPGKARSEMETAFGVDFSKVNIHTDKEAEQLTRSMRAQAFTYGRDIYFNAGKFNLDTSRGKHLLAHELTHVVQQGAAGKRRSGSGRAKMVQRNGEEMCTEEAPAAEEQVCYAPMPLPQTLVDDIVSRSIQATLAAYQTIPIVVTGQRAVENEILQQTVPETVSITVRVSAQYFINTDTGQEYFSEERAAADFRAIRRSLQEQGHMSVILSSRGGALGSGRAVEVGKGTPGDIKLFVEEAIRQGAVERYARAAGLLTEEQQLIDLPPANLQVLVQEWMRHTGVGVDCSGLVLYAAYQAREEMRRLATEENELLELFGQEYRFAEPEEAGRRIRGAASFRGGAQVSSPADLRPGDAWVVSGGGHIRIVQSVQTVTKDDGTQTIEFVSAESSGGSEQPLPGPVRRVWRTQSLTTFDPIVRTDGSGAGLNVTGTFHRTIQ